MSDRTRKTRRQSARVQRLERQRRKILTQRLKKRLKPPLKALTARVAAQVACHQVFDRLWCGPDAPMPRAAAYSYLAKITGRDERRAHIRLFDEPTCREVEERIKADYARIFKTSA